MNGIKNYWLHEANRLLELALIAAQGKSREYINKAIEALEKYEDEQK